MQRNEALKKLAEKAIQHLSSEQRENILLSDWWCLDINDADYNEIPQMIRQKIQSYDAPVDAESHMYDPLIIISLMNDFAGVKNEYIVRKLEEIGYRDITIIGDKEMLYSCPCCKYESLPGRAQYNICPVCFWEDAGDQTLQYFSTVNRMTLAEAQENFIRIGACSKNALQFVDTDGHLKFSRV